jgi:hypothetical protein
VWPHVPPLAVLDAFFYPWIEILLVMLIALQAPYYDRAVWDLTSWLMKGIHPNAPP